MAARRPETHCFIVAYQIPASFYVQLYMYLIGVLYLHLRTGCAYMRTSAEALGVFDLVQQMCALFGGLYIERAISARCGRSTIRCPPINLMAAS